MSIDDNWGEALRKSAELETAGDKSETRLKMRLTGGMFEGISYDYVALGIVTDTETYTFKTGGAGGTTVATVVIVYTDATRADILTVTKT